MPPRSDADGISVSVWSKRNIRDGGDAWHGAALSLP
jgi:hypothetical protein